MTELKVHARSINIEPMVHSDDVRKNFSLRLAQACNEAEIEEHGRGKKLSEAIGVTPKAVSKWLNAESMPRQSKMIELAKYLKVNIYWLQHGDIKRKIEAPQSNAELLGNMQSWDNKTPLGEDEVAIPFLSTVHLSAGHGMCCENEQDYGYRLRFSKSTLKQNGVNENDAVCVSVRGSSMEPVLPDGSTVGVNCGDTSLVDGKIYAINHGGDLFIKKLYKLPGGGIRIYSFNEREYPSKEYKETDVISEGIIILGRVFWYSVIL